MSRHSKNCTAHSIFTAGEKSKMMSEHGTIKARLGTESQKAFEECCLCLGRVREAVVCLQGHIFCKDCIYENLVQQNKQIAKEKELLEAEEKRREKEKARQHQAEMVSQIEKFNRVEMGIAKAQATQDQLKLSQLDANEQEKHKVIAELKDKSFNVMRQVAKKEWIKTSFWMPENSNTDKAVEKKQSEIEETKQEVRKAKLKMTCPYAPITSTNESHSIKFKDLVTLKLREDSSEGKASFVCQVCTKKLGHQKVVALRQCGHVMCKSCCDRFVMPSKKSDGQDGRCPQCNSKVKDRKRDIIRLHESGSAFASHS